MTSPSLAQRNVLADSGAAAAAKPAIRLIASNRLRMTDDLPFLLFLMPRKVGTANIDIPAPRRRGALAVECGSNFSRMRRRWQREIHAAACGAASSPGPRPAVRARPASDGKTGVKV